MQRSASICDLDSLKAWFDACGEKMMYWTLYNGSDTKGKLILRNEHTDEKNKSWELLEKIIKGQSRYGGIFYVFVPSTKAGSNGFGTEITLPPQSQDGTPAINGIGAVNGFPLGIGSLDEYRKQIVREMELEQRIKELEKEKEKDTTGVNPYIGAMMQHPTFDAKYATAGLFGLANNLVEIGKKMAGLPPSVQPTQAAIAGLSHKDASQTEETEETEDLEIDGGLLSQACVETSELITNEKPEIIYLALNAYLKENPSMMGMLLGQLQPYINKVKSEI